MLFHQAYKEFDQINIGGFDALAHKTAGDLVFLVRHELDLYEESEENDFKTRRQVTLAKRFISKWGKS